MLKKALTATVPFGPRWNPHTCAQLNAADQKCKTCAHCCLLQQIAVAYCKLLNAQKLIQSYFKI